MTDDSGARAGDELGRRVATALHDAVDDVAPPPSLRTRVLAGRRPAADPFAVVESGSRASDPADGDAAAVVPIERPIARRWRRRVTMGVAAAAAAAALTAGVLASALPGLSDEHATDPDRCEAPWGQSTD